ncbi:hypothetical protein LCGC14_1872560 [marine sediment metagenome]|uniref:Uncharacterized protein n=1 Tax=marine sediment metagenome TaxID=412755 RepID=A0A0F9J3A6_9ZZZZ
MTDLALTASKIALVNPQDAVVDFVICAVAVTTGQTLFVNSDGKAALADANVSGAQQTRHLALEGGAIGQTISALTRGRVFGFTITQAYDAPIYQSDTEGVLGDSVGTLTVPVGIIKAISDDPTLTKVLDFNPRRREDFS